MGTHAVETAAGPFHPSLTRHRGPVYWMRSYGLMLAWELRSMRLVLPIAIAAQILLGAGLVVGFGLLMGDIPSLQALYLVTGVTVISMITVGLVLVPQLIAGRKYSGVYEYMWSLPVPRTTSVAASLTVNSIIAVPGMVLALWVGRLRYDIPLDPSPLAVPAAVLILITAASVGFAMAHAIRNPLVTSLVTNVLLFLILLYSPINFPPDRLPAWLAAVHLGLPFQHAANVMRAGLTHGIAANVGSSVVVLGVWALAAWGLTAWVVGRRP